MDQLLQLVDEINSKSFMYLNDNDLEEIRIRAHNSSMYKPSGPRDQSNGVSDDRQGILSAQLSQDGLCCVLKITTLAAGFVIGQHGMTIRSLCDLNGAKSISWSQTYGEDQIDPPLDIRVLLVKGTSNAILCTVHTICKAVQRYQDLVNGRLDARVVEADQMVDGVIFKYKPPPSTAMPGSARVASRKRSNNKRRQARSQRKAEMESPNFIERSEQPNQQSLERVGSSSAQGVHSHDQEPRLDNNSSQSFTQPISHESEYTRHDTASFQYTYPQHSYSCEVLPQCNTTTSQFVSQSIPQPVQSQRVQYDNSYQFVTQSQTMVQHNSSNALMLPQPLVHIPSMDYISSYPQGVSPPPSPHTTQPSNLYGYRSNQVVYYHYYYDPTMYR
eukprot:TRINITY_DN3797_c0_g2_i2.p1 TRINITY_DN3797_c0_g2~~TRINITY_DN3797_c0_g2_i2.p1  ORF type:complete len:387 (+),score=1.25 TRINITY_DN3797_c0_g2_i2:143-1303(+)